MKSALRSICCGIATLISAVAAAQDAAPRNPADPSVAVAAPRYESAFSGYARHRDEKIAPWREVNDDVGRIGGHIGILRGATPSKPAPAAPKER
jgi:hypothetical protein